jgi:hypothetical protein
MSVLKELGAESTPMVVYSTSDLVIDPSVLEALSKRTPRASPCRPGQGSLDELAGRMDASFPERAPFQVPADRHDLRPWCIGTDGRFRRYGDDHIEMEARPRPPPRIAEAVPGRVTGMGRVPGDPSRFCRPSTERSSRSCGAGGRDPRWHRDRLASAKTCAAPGQLKSPRSEPAYFTASAESGGNGGERPATVVFHRLPLRPNDRRSKELAANESFRTSRRTTSPLSSAH